MPALCWVLGARDTAINRTDRVPALMELQPSVGTQTINKNKQKVSASKERSVNK